MDIIGKIGGYMFNNLEKASSLIDDVLGCIDSGSLEAIKLLTARNLIDTFTEGTKSIIQQFKAPSHLSVLRDMNKINEYGTLYPEMMKVKK